MQLRILRLLIAVSLAPLAAALQSIYFGVESPPSGPGQCLAFFSDSDACDDSTAFYGGSYCYGDFCDVPITILGHPNITFTGCVPNTNPVRYTALIPSGVSDNGVPALVCQPAGNAPGSPFASCLNGGRNGYGGYVNVDAYCS